MFKSILVLEAPWDTDTVKSKSVWPFVSEFANVMNIEAYHHVFSDKASFTSWIKQYNKEIDVPTPKLLYIAAHGSQDGISGIDRATINNTLKNKSNIKYVHFGSCLYGTEKNLESLLKVATHIKWAAGYEKKVDWIDSTIFDIMLWRRIAVHEKHNKGHKFYTMTNDFIKNVYEIAKELDFRMQYRIGNKIQTYSIKPTYDEDRLKGYDKDGLISKLKEMKIDPNDYEGKNTKNKLLALIRGKYDNKLI
jgi:hypothetical protein